MNRPSSGPRIGALDSLRGVAASLVVLTHCAGVYQRQPWWVVHLPLSVVFWSGNRFVLVFFALSGYVLFLPFVRGSVAYTPFLVRRFMRIYPPFATAILLSAALYVLIEPRPIPGLSTWFNESSWLTWPSLRVIARHLAMRDELQSQWLDNAMWSLVHEMRLSIVFPFLAWCVLTNWRATVTGSLLVSAASAYLARWHPVALAGIEPFSTLQYLFLFAGGAALCQHAGRVRQYVSAWQPLSIALALCAILALIATPLDSPALDIVVGSIAALALVALISTGALDRLLLHVVPRWLGRVSYSLYLFHLLALLSLVHLLAGRAPLIAILGLAALTSLVFAEVAYRLIERPSITLGKWMAARV